MHDSLRTLHGRITLAICLFAAVPAWQILWNGGNVLDRFLASGTSVDFRFGGILLGEVALTLAFIFTLPILLVKEFVMEERKSPLRAHPFALPEEAFMRVVGVVVWLSSFFWVSFHLFFLYLLLGSGGSGGWGGVLFHFVAGQLFFTSLGIGGAALTRIPLLRRGGAEWSRRYFLFGTVPFVLLYPLFLYLPNSLAEWIPEWVEALGAHRFIHLLQPQASAWLAMTWGRWMDALAWTLLLIGLAIGSISALWRWRTRAPIELVLDGDGPGRRMRPLPFLSAGSIQGGRGAFRLFWIKDSLAAALRDPLKEFRFHGLLITLTGAMIWIVGRRIDVGAIPETMGDLIHSAYLLSIIAILAMRSTLGRLGMEGRTMALLRPILSPRALLSIKMGAGILNSILLAEGYALLLIGLAIAFGAGVEHPLILLFEGISWGFGLAIFGSALGFLLPDFERSSLFQPGASFSGRVLFLIGGGICAGSYLAGKGLHRLELIGWSQMLILGGLAVTLLLGASVFCIHFALRNFDGRRP